MIRNLAGQTVGAQLNSKTDGSAVTSGTTSVYVTGDGGAQTQGNGGGSPGGFAVHEGNGFWTYSPEQPETDYAHVAFTFVNSSAVIATVQIYPTINLSGLATAVEANGLGISDIQSRLPDDLAGGLMRSYIEDASSEHDIATMQGTIDNIETVTNQISAVADRVDAMIEVAPGSPTYDRWKATSLEEAPTGAVPTVSEIADEVQTRTIAAVTVVNGLAANTVTASALAADAVTEIQNGLATTAALNTVEGKVDTIDGIVDSILTDTAEIGAAGAGLTSIPWNAAWDAEVESEVADAIVAYDPPTKAELDSAVSPLATTADLAVVDGIVDDILEDTAEIGTAGAGLSAIPWNAAWDAEVQSEAADALTAYDPPTHAELTSAVSGLATAANLSTLTGYVDTEVAAIKVTTDRLGTMIELAPGSPTYYRWLHTALEQFDVNAVEGTVTWRQSARGWNAALLGKASGMSSTTATLRDIADTKDRIVATVDSSGNRTAVTLDLT